MGLIHSAQQRDQREEAQFGGGVSVASGGDPGSAVSYLVDMPILIPLRIQPRAAAQPAE